MKINLPVTGKERVYGDDVTIISMTDLKGIITYVNRDFVEVSGYSEQELLGKNHNIVRHPDVPPVAFQDLWDTIKAGHSWRGIVKNRCKSGDHYWVDAYVTPVFERGELIGYQSVRSRPDDATIAAADALYAKLRESKATRLPKKRSLFDLSLKLRIFAALLVLSLLAVGAGIVAAIGSAQQQKLIAAHMDQLDHVERAWSEFKAAAPPGAETGRLSETLDGLLRPEGARGVLARATTVADHYGLIILAICVAGLVAMVVIGMLLVRTVVKPVQLVTNFAKEIAGGHLQQRIEVRSQDEIGDMLQSMKLMQARLRTCFGRFAESATELAAAAEQLSTAGERTTRDMQHQQEKTAQVAGSVREMSSAVQEVARHTGEAAEAAREADAQATGGKQVVERSRNAIEALAGEVERTGEVVHRLEEDGNNISSIMEVISGIAEQTNLLALNAAIEAARAGESGRGFAVVADEVRTLAQRTQNATTEIQNVIDHLKVGIADAVEVMGRGREQAEKAVSESANTNKALDAITGSVEVITRMSAQIAAAAQEQSSAVEGVSSSVVTINELGQDTTESARAIADAGVHLAKLASDLQELIGAFAGDRY